MFGFIDEHAVAPLRAGANCGEVHLETRDQIRAHFDRVLAFCRDRCGGKKVYYVVNYDGFFVNLGENDFYAEQMRRVLECSSTVVRNGGDSLQRIAARLCDMKLHSPTPLHDSGERHRKSSERSSPAR